MPLSLRNSSIFFLSIVHTILLLLTVTAIGLCSNILGFFVFGIMVVLDKSQSSCTLSVSALLKHFNKYFLVISSFIRTFISSAGILSTPEALLFFILLIVSTKSFSDIMGVLIISELPCAISSICCLRPL